MRLLLRAVLAGWLSCSLFQALAAAPPPGFVALYNGRDLSGWWGTGDTDPRTYIFLSPAEYAKRREASLPNIQRHWQAAGEELVNDGQGLFLTTEKFFRDIELLIDYKTVPRADSGIYLKGTPQIQIWDYTDTNKFRLGAHKGSGGLWNNSPGAPGKDPLVLADKPFGEWNHFRILQLGTRTTVYLNDQLVVDNAIMENYFDRTRKMPLPPFGPIQLQTHGGEIRWRHIFVREIPAEEANRRLRGQDEGFTPLFNGRDFTGWQGPLDNYEIKDGAIVCKPGKGGTIYTKEEYGDFVVRLEFKLPPGGNNGLAIRYPGQGDTAYVGMCELQVLDDNYEQVKNTKIDPRQAHGSAYGMVAAYRGYQRPVGEWNYQEVTVVGSKIKVELNGTIILDCDLSKVTEFMGNTPHPGKDRTRGYFGFAGHNDPVMFRNIAIKKL
ncbi:DUF1080 domain-containing protein [Fontisphaera persica]|uniref:3-keto-disaccharide hydrolase n=1 Tax=Fontisphaera persica TaxID=2974023 RepID=UPI0024BF351F|nr:DUF1080 domain-containing protein [Fontisphaera persica]WCJ61226.1 DUF1080 domain-containing protein [Fontisphaera persica]